jgi:hypothetical protein
MQHRPPDRAAAQPQHSRSTAPAQLQHSRSTAAAQPQHSRSAAAPQPHHSRSTAAAQRHMSTPGLSSLAAARSRNSNASRATPSCRLACRPLRAQLSSAACSAAAATSTVVTAAAPPRPAYTLKPPVYPKRLSTLLLDENAWCARGGSRRACATGWLWRACGRVCVCVCLCMCVGACVWGGSAGDAAQNTRKRSSGSSVAGWSPQRATNAARHTRCAPSSAACCLVGPERTRSSGPASHPRHTTAAHTVPSTRRRQQHTHPLPS